MILIRRLQSLARWLFHRRDVEAELDRELKSYIEMSAADGVRRGEPQEQGERRARLEIGGLEQTKELIRSGRWGAELDRFRQDLHYGWRSLARDPGFTAVVVLTLAIGIGVNTAIYTVLDATMLRPLPFKEPQRLMKVSLTRPPEKGVVSTDLAVWSYPKYETFQQNQQVFEDVALYRNVALNLTGDGEPERVRAEEVTASYFPALGIVVETGRAFVPEEDAIPGKDFVALISHSLWERRFGSDRTIAGKTITLDSKTYTVLGVLPAGFQGLSGPADIWVPVHRSAAEFINQRWSHSWEFIARLKPGMSVEQARSAVAVLGKLVDEAHKDPFGPGGGGWGAKIEALNEVRVDPVIRKLVWILFGAVTCVLLIACANIANLLLARATTRQREMAIRAAIGAGRARIVRQLLTESLLLAVLGGAASVLVAYASVYALSVISPTQSALAFGQPLQGLTLLGLSLIRVNFNALWFTCAVALLAGVLFGLAPAWQGSRGELTDTIKKTDDHRCGFHLRSKSALVVLEIALAFILLTGAGLVMKSLARLTATPFGISPENILTARVAVPSGGPMVNGTINFFSQLEERIAGQPGVLSVALGSCHALSSGCERTLIWFRDRPEVPRGTEPPIGVVRVSPGYFSTMKIPLIRGRLFRNEDRFDSPKVIVISETTAQRYFPGEDAIGRPIGIGINGFGQRAEIIGIVGNVRYNEIDQSPRPDAYVSLLQAPQQNLYLFARAAGDPMLLIPSVRQQVAEINKNLPIYDVRSMEDRIGDAAARARFSAVLLTIFAGMALVLAAIGIYGVMSYMVRQRTREIGIRVALGARSQDVVRHVVRRTVGLILAGTVVGVAAALAATQVLTNSLYEVRPDDPQTYVLIALILAAVALLASYIPVRRASAIDPATTLRAD